LASYSWKTATLFGSIFGSLIAAVMMYVAWQHNVQGEIHGDTGINWQYWLLIGMTWFALSAPLCSFVAGVLLRLGSNMPFKKSAGSKK